MRTDELDFNLPPDLIAQSPPPTRGDSRLLHYRRANKSISHTRFANLSSLLRRGDLLVFNDARVIPARFMLLKPTGGKIEGLFLSQSNPNHWRVLLKNASNISNETPLRFSSDAKIVANIAQKFDAGECELQFEIENDAISLLEKIGRMPLPPYIKREKEIDARDADDRDRYQTVYAAAAGSVAAPTAGLHFTDSLFKELELAGVEKTFVTLHVGLGTFKPVTAENLENHAMHREAYSISAYAAEAINRAKSEGRRIIAVGTTAARVLESQPADSEIKPRSAETSIFIRPPYEWKWVNSLVTNFHLPRSTLLALVAAMVDLEEQRRIYRAAIEHRYRFFSFGDAMWIE